MKRRSFATRVGAICLAVGVALSGFASVPVAAASASNTGELSTSVDGVSKVIGLEGESGSGDAWTYNGNKYYYNYPNDTDATRVQVYGDVAVKDAATGFYNYGGVSYGDAYYDRKDDITTFSGKVLKVLGTSVSSPTTNTYFDATPYVNGPFYTVDGVTYEYLSSTYLYDEVTKTRTEVYYIGENTSKIDVLGTYASRDEYDAAKLAMARQADGSAVTTTDDAKYYAAPNGKFYRYVKDDWDYDVADNKVYYAYAYVSNEIVFVDKADAKISWNELSAIENDITSDGKTIYIGYQVEVDGVVTGANDNYNRIVKDASGNVMYLQYNNWFGPSKKLAYGESVKVRVRGVYYTKTETDMVMAETKHGYQQGDLYVQTVYNVYKTGAWSDAYTYTRTAKQVVPAVTGVTVKQDGSKIKLTWNPIESVSRYSVYTIHSKVQLATLTSENFGKFYDEDAETLKAAGIVDTTGAVDYTVIDGYSFTTSTPSYSFTYRDNSLYENYAYHYYVVAPDTLRDDDEYEIGETVYSNIASLAFEVPVEAPTVKNLRIENYVNSPNFKIAWDIADANSRVYVYAYEKKTFPAYYNYNIMGARAEVQDTYEYRLHDDDWNEKTIKAPLFVATYTDNSNPANPIVYYGRYYIDDKGQKKLEYHRFYKDDSDDYDDSIYLSSDMQESVVYTTTPCMTTIELSGELSEEELNKAGQVQCETASLRDGYIESYLFDLTPGKTYYFVAHTFDNKNADVIRTTPIATYDGINYTMYNDVSAASKKVSKKISTTLYQPALNASVTKDSVKLVMNDGDYDSNISGYQIYRMNGKGKYKKIATINNNEYTDEELTLGTKYTYKVRSYYYNVDTKKTSYSPYAVVSAVPSNIKGTNLNITQKSKTSVKLSWTKVAKATKYEIYRCDTSNYDPKTVTEKNINTGKYELIKTINKASTTSYTDKKLKADKTYSYIVKVYYKEGKTTGFIESGNYVYTGLTAPSNIKVKISGSTAKVTWDACKFAKGYEISYTVYDKNDIALKNISTRKTTKKTSYSIKNIPSGGSVYVSLRAYDSSKTYSDWYGSYNAQRSLKTTSGIKASYNKTKKAVKVSWKKVSGAKYYKVYRSTTSPKYNKTEKKYYNQGLLIAKESNNDEYYDEVRYTEYYGINGSIAGTSAYDYARLQTGVTYYYTVVAYGELGTQIASYVTSQNSIYGDTDSYASGKPATYVHNPKKVTVKSVKNTKAGQVTIKFKKVSGAKKYIILRSTKKNGGYEQIGTTKKTTFVDKKAKKGKTYYYKVVAVSLNGLQADVEYSSAAKKIKVKK